MRQGYDCLSSPNKDETAVMVYPARGCPLVLDSPFFSAEEEHTTVRVAIKTLFLFFINYGREFFFVLFTFLAF